MGMRWLWLVLTLCSWPAFAEVRDPLSYFFMPKLGDFKAELDTAKQEGKVGVLLMFELEDCPWCHRMKATILNQSDVQDWYRQHFSIFNVDAKGDTAMVDFAGKQTTEKAFAAEQRVRATPVFIFYDLSGKAAYRYTGATQSKEDFLLLGHYVAEGAYKSQAFNVYKAQAGKQ